MHFNLDNAVEMREEDVARGVAVLFSVRGSGDVIFDPLTETTANEDDDYAEREID
jgi:hypothetical protein